VARQREDIRICFAVIDLWQFGEGKRVASTPCFAS